MATWKILHTTLWQYITLYKVCRMDRTKQCFVYFCWHQPIWCSHCLHWMSWCNVQNWNTMSCKTNTHNTVQFKIVVCVSRADILRRNQCANIGEINGSHNKLYMKAVAIWTFLQMDETNLEELSTTSQFQLQWNLDACRRICMLMNYLIGNTVLPALLFSCYVYRCVGVLYYHHIYTIRASVSLNNGLWNQ